MINRLNLSDETITIIENFSNMFFSIDRDYSAVREALSDVNREQQDLLHELELSPLDAVERSIVANKLIEVRKRRRQLANDMAIVEPMIRFAKGHESLKIPMAKLLNDMQKTKENLSGRQYTPRVRKDIKLFQGELSREDLKDE